MPVLKDFRQTKTITLPSFPDSKIEIYDSLLVGDMAGVDFQKPEVEVSIDALPKYIKSWNFTNDKGEDLPVNRDSLGLLSAEDATFLFEAIAAFSEEVKKKTASSQV